MFADEDRNLIPKVSDFGYATLAAGQDELVQLAITRPWNAPEIHHRGDTFELSVAKKMDSYSVGVLCIWILFRNRYEKWISSLQTIYEGTLGTVVAADLLGTIELIKGSEQLELAEFAEILVALNDDLTRAEMDDLTKLFHKTLTSDLNERSNDFVELLQLLGDKG